METYTRSKKLRHGLRRPGDGLPSATNEGHLGTNSWLLIREVLGLKLFRT